MAVKQDGAIAAVLSLECLPILIFKSKTRVFFSAVAS